MRRWKDWLASQWLWQIGLVLTVGAAALLQAPALQQLEWRLYDRGLAWMPTRAPVIAGVSIEIDARSLAGQGADLQIQLARLVHLLQKDGARAVGILLPLDADPGLPPWFTALTQTLQDSALVAADRASVNRMQRLLAEGERDLDRTRLLARVMAESGMSYLSFRLGASLPAAATGSRLPDSLLQRAIPPRPGTSVLPTESPLGAGDASRSTFPAPRLANAAAGLGLLDAPADQDGVTRSLPLVVPEQGRYYAALPLLLAAHWMQGSVREMTVEPGKGIHIGPRFIPTMPDMRIHVGRMDAAGAQWKRIRLADVPPTATGLFQGRLVLIGYAAELDRQRRATAQGLLSEAEWVGGVAERLTEASYVIRPPWAEQGRWTAIAGAALMVLVLPLLPPWLAISLSGGLGAGLLGAFAYLLLSHHWWVALGTPAALLLIGGVIAAVHRLWQYLRDLAYLEDDGDRRPWWGEVGPSLRSLRRNAWDRVRGRTAPGAAVIAVAGAAALPEEPPPLRAALNKTRPPVRRAPDPEASMATLARAPRRAPEATSASPRVALPASKPPSSATARTLGRYTIENQLGKGAMGAVYRGVDPRINRVVAIKTLNLQQEFEAEELEQVKERFFHEAEVAGRLNHPHIVTIYDVGEDHGLGFIAMELIDGHDMRRYTRKEQLLPINRIMEMAAQIAEALDFAHRNGVVHRDIKPSNIMLDKSGRQVKVADFGIARIGSSGKTRTGTVLGTPPYMSPEQLSGRPLDGRSDVFSLGVVLFELVTGRRPFEGDTVATLMSRIANDRHPDLMTLRGGVPACLRNIIDKTLEKDPDKRYPNAGALRLALLRCIENNYTGTGFSGRGA